MSLLRAIVEATGLADPAMSKYARTASPRQAHLTGLRGILVLESLLWIFFRTFVPAMASTDSPGPTYQRLLRLVLSVPFWDESLISSFFILLSARTICVPFLQNPCAATYAGSLIRRPLRMAISLSLASGLAILILSQLGTAYIEDFKSTLPNDSIATPATASTALVVFNSIFDLFWTVGAFSDQAANTFWPSATLWGPSLIYYQGYTVYMLMVLLPFTRPGWHSPGLALFALGAFWLGSWGWYSAAGLLLADVATDESLHARLRNGFKVAGTMRCPPLVTATALVTAGLAMKYAWAAVPRYSNAELKLHPFFHFSDYTTTATFDKTCPYPRLDDFLVISGVLFLVEVSDAARSLLSLPPLLWLGERSLSEQSIPALPQSIASDIIDSFLTGIFVAQSIVFWTVGMQLFLYVHVEQDLSIAAANAVVFGVCLLAVFLFAEAYHRLVDLPSQWAAKVAFAWLLT